jgi:single-strand DNA-binding protein
MNKAILIGNLGADPELRYTPDNKAVATFSLATNESRDKVEWHNIVAWEKQADVIHKYAQKGDKVAVEGKIKTRSWEDRDGIKRYRTEVVCYRVELLSPKARHAADQPPPIDQPTDANGAPISAPAGEDDLPF